MNPYLCTCAAPVLDSLGVCDRCHRLFVLPCQFCMAPGVEPLVVDERPVMVCQAHLVDLVWGTAK